MTLDYTTGRHSPKTNKKEKARNEAKLL
ncbi:uncharacterized protein G2W53_044366 [Senna tora]|uniref:Uncharacterized protein n=1 Tax=Senna tora TaxID=362788 RepID=A0A834SJ65_9FABA|nr:uncharacterized protein G2W53_044366 [Senna tora]